MPFVHKSILLAALFGSIASAQVGVVGPLTCNIANFGSPNLRADGFSEPVADVAILCAGGTTPSPGAAVPAITFTVSFNTNVTSRLLPINGDSSTSNFSEALLLVDDPGSGLQGYAPNLPQTICSTPLTGCAATVGAVVGSPTYGQSVTSGVTPAPNVYQGIVSGNSVTFYGVPFLIPGSGGRVFRITNLRVNAHSLAIPTTAPIPAQASVSLSGPASAVLMNSTVTVGFNAPGFSAATATATTLGQNTSQTKTAVSILSFNEVYGPTFKTRVLAQSNTAYAGQTNSPNQAIPAYVYNSESGFVLPIGTQKAGLTEFGTRLKAEFNNVPAGVHLFVSTANVVASGTAAPVPAAIGGSAANALAGNGDFVPYARLVTSETITDGDAAGGAFPAVTPTATAPGTLGTVPVVELPVSNGFATAVWEVLNTSPDAAEALNFEVYVSYTGGIPLPGTASVQLSYAPTALSANNLSNAPRPIFAPDALAARPIFTLQAPPTVLAISKSHVGSFGQGQTNAFYTVDVANIGTSPTSGTTTVTDTLPAGLTLSYMSGDGWSCAANSCSRTNSIAAGNHYPPISVAVNVATNAGSPQVNSVSVSGGNATTASATDITYILPPCTFQLFGTTAFASPDSVGSITVFTSCGWNATTTANWLHLINASWSGNGIATYQIEANTSPFPRTATVMISGQAFFITQNAANARLRFVPITPCRIADTRNVSAPSLPAATIRNIVVAGVCGVPPNAEAYSLNLTVVPPGPLGFLSVWPAGQPQPVVSTLNSIDGRVKANAAIVPAGVSGWVTLFASNPTDAIVDINGYFVPAAGNADLVFYPLTPCRIVDTRIGTGALAGPALTAATSRNFPVLSGSCSIPATAQAYALNVTAVPSGPLGFLSVWPAGLGQPGSSTLNAPTGAVTANATVVPAGTNGGVAVIATNPTHVIIDINGYFAPPGAAGGLHFYTVTPCRIFDTRGAAGPYGGPAIGISAQRDFNVAGAACGIPSNAGGFSLNATVVPPGALGFLSLWGPGGQPTVSTLNAGDGSVVANAALVPASSTGSVSAFASNLTHLILDINGYFAQ